MTTVVRATAKGVGSHRPTRRLLTTWRFWTSEVWGPEWDRDRRRMLMRHYGSYLRNPELPQSYVPTPASVRQQEEYSAWFRFRITSAQASDRVATCRLTFRPLGKNLRAVGTALRRNTLRNLRTVIAQDAPGDEIRLLRAHGHEWHPWPWSRGVLAHETADARAAWHAMFVEPHPRPREPSFIRRPRLGSDEPFSIRLLQAVLELAASTSWVFAPQPAFADAADRMMRRIEWPANEPVLGIHVRRGDAAAGGAPAYDRTNATRASFPIEEYLRAADRLCEAYGIRHIFLATESAAEIEAAKELRPQYRFLVAEHDRAIFPDLQDSPRFIEFLALEDPARGLALAESAIVDLACFHRCRAFVGSFNSEFSMLAWLLATGHCGHVVPFVSLSSPRRRLSLHPFRALLNIENNCPLELHHW